jgi:hypothetical protein
MALAFCDAARYMDFVLPIGYGLHYDAQVAWCRAFMTAEIAVMNQSAIALAADSAATRSEAKIFAANKIFALSKYHPVAVMIHGDRTPFIGPPLVRVGCR